MSSNRNRDVLSISVGHIITLLYFCQKQIYCRPQNCWSTNQLTKNASQENPSQFSETRLYSDKTIFINVGILIAFGCVILVANALAFVVFLDQNTLSQQEVKLSARKLDHRRFSRRVDGDPTVYHFSWYFVQWSSLLQFPPYTDVSVSVEHQCFAVFSLSYRH